MDFESGAYLYGLSTADKIEDLSMGLDWLQDTEMDIPLLRRWMSKKAVCEDAEYSWNQTQLSPRSETITLADAVATAVTVADSGAYSVGELLRCENEIMRVTALANATTLTVTRGYIGTAAAHSAKTMLTVGKANVENSTAGDAKSRTPSKLSNYVQTFDEVVEASWLRMASKHTSGNTLDLQTELAFIEANRKLAAAMLYGKKKKDTTNKIYAMGGFFEMVSSNATNVGGALTIAAIDALILDIVEAGGDPKGLSLSPYQKQKLDALDANKQMLGKRERTGGNLITQTWQSGILSHELDIVVDKTLRNDELIIFDDDQIEVGPMSGNGLDGNWGTFNAAENGQHGSKKRLLGTFGMKVHNEKAHGYLYGLS